MKKTSQKYLKTPKVVAERKWLPQVKRVPTYESYTSNPSMDKIQEQIKSDPQYNGKDHPHHLHFWSNDQHKHNSKEM